MIDAVAQIAFRDLKASKTFRQRFRHSPSTRNGPEQPPQQKPGLSIAREIPAVPSLEGRADTSFARPDGD
jgi:hypothetical protein